MKMVPVQSSNLQEVGYDADRREMKVNFKNGGSHTHVDVPAEKYAGLMGAESHGRYYNEHFVKAQHPGQRGEQAPPAATKPTGSAPINGEPLPPARNLAEAMERYTKPQR